MDFGEESNNNNNNDDDQSKHETPLNLVMQFLHDSGYTEALSALECEM